MNELVFDIETERELREVGGKENIHLLGVSVVGVYEYGRDEFYAYEKEEFPKLEEALKRSTLLIGFNSKHFDIPVLEPHVHFPLRRLASLDLMEDVERALGFRISLDNIARATLNKGKSGVGLEAIEWWRQGQKEKVKEYCLQDVRLTRDIYEFGKQEGYILGDTRDRGRMRIPVNWSGKRNFAPRQILEEALKTRRSVEIEYAGDPGGPSQKRKIDVYAIYADTCMGFCHLRRGKRVFQLDKISNVVLTADAYQLEEDVQRSLI